MRIDQHKRGVILAATLLGALLAASIESSPSAAQMSDKSCVNLVGFSANIARYGGSATRIPATGFQRAREILDKTPNHATIEADSAFFDEMPDGSSAIVFAKGPCVAAIMLTPPFVPRATVKAILFDEKPAAPKEETLPPGMSRA